MTKKLLLVLLSIFLVCSARAQVRENLLPRSISPIYYDYVWDFIARSKGKITFLDFQHIVINPTQLEYSEKGEGIIGLCTWGFMARNHIEIDETYYKTHGVYQQWQLLFHELGHCICNEPHPDITRADSWIINLLNKINIHHVRYSKLYLHDGCPRTLMYPYNLSESCIRAHQDYYVEELFANCNPSPVYFGWSAPDREHFSPDRLYDSVVPDRD